MNLLDSFMGPSKILVFLLIFIDLALWSQETKFSKALFEQGVISTQEVEYGCTFSADGTEIYFVRSPDPWASPNSTSAIYHSKKVSGKWTTPKIAAFSGRAGDSDPFLTTDGKRLYFVSDRSGSQDIWWVEKMGETGWGDPKQFPSPINSDAREYSPKTDNNGNLYFASDRESGFGQGDLYMSRFTDGQFMDPENLGASVNRNTGEWNLEISGDGTILIFEASGRKENQSPYGDLYIAFKKEDSWTTPQNIIELNSTGSDLYPLLRDNGSLLYYSSSDSLSSKNTNIYSIPFLEILEGYRKNASMGVE